MQRLRGKRDTKALEEEASVCSSVCGGLFAPSQEEGRAEGAGGVRASWWRQQACRGVGAGKGEQRPGQARTARGWAVCSAEPGERPGPGGQREQGLG